MTKLCCTFGAASISKGCDAAAVRCCAWLCFELQCAAVTNFIAVPGDCAATKLSSSDS